MSGEGAPFQKTCPANGDVVWTGRAASGAQVGQAVKAARAAFETWGRTEQVARQVVLERYAEELRLRKEAMALAISRDMGKLLKEARTEVDTMVAKVAVSIKAQADRAGEHSLPADFGHLDLTHRPHGVMAVFGPYNFPGHLPNGHIVPALLAGNTCVFKASELAPSVAPLMMDAFRAAGLPPGCVNLVQGGRETGGDLLAADINGLLFTGSEHTGRMFHRFLAGRPEVILALEMGGNNPLIVWDSADAEAAADIAIQSAYLTTGQRCSCARRLILPKGRFGDQVLESIVDRARRLSIGPWNDDTAFMGPLVSAHAAAQAVAFQNKLIAGGARAILPLEQRDKNLGFVSAGVVDMSDAPPMDEEMFGPLLQVYRADDIDQAITLANATRFGLAGGLVCDDLPTWDLVRNRLRAGILNLNRPTVGASGQMPFGGPGASGNFRPGAYYAADYCAWPQASQVAPSSLG
ncbi:MAG: succinylglutamate-semialdehyde dehydrogenase [Hyphomonadaceae bacterium BRH_c29]|nr:MAG: succinylglutamate-semialdehyde dehydrogenase [Hyphomonadaceae bacterium BRH_c29]